MNEYGYMGLGAMLTIGVLYMGLALHNFLVCTHQWHEGVCDFCGETKP